MAVRLRLVYLSYLWPKPKSIAQLSIINLLRSPGLTSLLDHGLMKKDLRASSTVVPGDISLGQLRYSTRHLLSINSRLSSRSCGWNGPNIYVRYTKICVLTAVCRRILHRHATRSTPTYGSRDASYATRVSDADEPSDQPWQDYTLFTCSYHEASPPLPSHLHERPSSESALRQKRAPSTHRRRHCEPTPR